VRTIIIIIVTGYNYSIRFDSVKALVLSLAVLGDITDGVHAELIRSDSGLLLGIRVSWSWLSSDPVECFQSPEVQLLLNFVVAIQRTLNSTSRNNSVEFTDLDCNTKYLPTVRATIVSIQGVYEYGNQIFFGGIKRKPVFFSQSMHYNNFFL
jgi:hypothetical protein